MPILFRPKVLLISADSSAGNKVATTLSKEGFETVSVSSPTEGLDELSLNNFDAVIFYDGEENYEALQNFSPYSLIVIGKKQKKTIPKDLMDISDDFYLYKEVEDKLAKATIGLIQSKSQLKAA